VLNKEDFDEEVPIGVERKFEWGRFSIAKYLPEQTVVVGGISKELGATGLRLGWAMGPSHFIEPLVKLCASCTNAVNAPLQFGLADFLQKETSLAIRLAIRDQFHSLRDLVMKYFRELPSLSKLTCTPPKGAFYLFPNCEAYFGAWDYVVGGEKRRIEINSDEDFVNYLFDVGKVIAIAGTKFGLLGGHFRICFARNPETITKGLTAMANALDKLQKCSLATQELNTIIR